MRIAWVAACLVALGCDGQIAAVGAPGAGPGAPAAAGEPEASPPLTAGDRAGVTQVYAHDSSRLFQLDPESLAFTVVGDFDCVHIDDPAQLNDERSSCCIGMTDIAIDAGGRMLGALRDVGRAEYQLVEIDKRTASCRILGSLGDVALKGLTFAPAGTIDASAEVLVGVDLSCGYWRIATDPVAPLRIGTLSACAGKGGDLVGVTADETFAVGDGALLAIDPRTGEVRRRIGELDPRPSSYPNGGLGYWGGVLYGFGLDGSLITIDAQTAATAVVPLAGALPAGFTFPQRPGMFAGAGVTTAAPRIL